MNNEVAITGPSRSGHGSAPMDRRRSAFTMEWETQPPAGTVGSVREAPLFLVVGYDGTPPAQRALDSAARLLHDRDGALEIVYVAHVPVGAALSADAVVEVENGFDDLEGRLADEVRSRLGVAEPRWHFQRRNGEVADELAAVAGKLGSQQGPEARIGIVVGGSAHRDHRFLGSVSMNLERVDRFPVMVVP
jgi:nucleotide-binding universal stress UspA family protein